jgi:hypothetical protein
LVDLAASPSSAQGIKYETKTATGQSVTHTLPCGSPIPPGAVCVCTCIPGSWSAPVPTPTYSSSCTCLPVHYWYPT